MANIQALDVREYRTMPIHHIRLGIAGGGDYYGNLLEGSNFKFSPVVRMTDEGQKRTVALKFEGKFIVGQNDLDVLLTGLQNITSSTLTDFDMWLCPGWTLSYTDWQDANKTPHSAYVQVTCDTISTQPFCKKWSVDWSLDENTEAPQLTINVLGLFSTDILTKSRLFTIIAEY